MSTWRKEWPKGLIELLGELLWEKGEAEWGTRKRLSPFALNSGTPYESLFREMCSLKWIWKCEYHKTLLLDSAQEILWSRVIRMELARVYPRSNICVCVCVQPWKHFLPFGRHHHFLVVSMKTSLNRTNKKFWAFTMFSLFHLFYQVLNLQDKHFPPFASADTS